MTTIATHAPATSVTAILRSGLSAALRGIRRRKAEMNDAAILARLDKHILKDIGLDGDAALAVDRERLQQVLACRYMF